MFFTRSLGKNGLVQAHHSCRIACRGYITAALHNGNAKAPLHRFAQKQSPNACLTHWSSLQATPTKLRDLCTVGLDEGQRIRHSSFLRKELCVRLAQSAAHLHTLPHGWSDKTLFKEIINSHKDAIQALESCPCPEAVSKDDEITKVFDTIATEFKTVGSVPEMLFGLRELTAELNDQCQAIPYQVNKVLTDFFTLRTGMRFLIQHHMESRQGRRFGYSGILQLNCNPAKVARAAARDSSNLCVAALGQAPEVVIQGDTSETLIYVPSVLQYMLTEIIKNACRAVVERHAVTGYDDVLPPVVCKIEGSPDGLTIKIRDEGTGMSKRQLDRVWDFLYTTYKDSAWHGHTKEECAKMDTQKAEKKGSAALCGYGVGLPLSRMYSRYFGGDIVLSSTEGSGTEVCINLSRSPVCSEVLPEDFWLDQSYLHSAPDMHATTGGSVPMSL